MGAIFLFAPLHCHSMDRNVAEPIISDQRYRLLPHARRSAITGTYSAYDIVNKRNVVLLELDYRSENESIHLSSDDLSFDAWKLTELDHVSLINVWDFVIEAERSFLVFEPIEGRNFAELFSKERSPALSNVLQWADDLFDVLIYLHTRSEPFIHDDINPSSVWLTFSAKIKLNFPSVQRSAREELASAGDDPNSLLPYRSIEYLWDDLDIATKMVISRGFGDAPVDELLKEKADERSDIYSLSATLYYALTKVAPCDVMTRTISILDGSSDPLTPIHELNSDISEPISNVIMRGLATKRADRYNSAYEMRMELLTATEPLFDNLTRLPNETQFMTHLRSTIDRYPENEQGKYVVMVIELDDVNEIYGRFGRLSGDQVFIAASDRLKSGVRINDIIGRLALNKFAVLLFDAGSVSDLETISNRVQKRLAEPLDIDDSVVAITSSIGISNSIAANEPEQLLFEAGAAAQASKELGPNRFTIYPNRA